MGFIVDWQLTKICYYLLTEHIPPSTKSLLYHSMLLMSVMDAWSVLISKYQQWLEHIHYGISGDYVNLIETDSSSFAETQKFGQEFTV